jgi:hypothetical protein
LTSGTARKLTCSTRIECLAVPIRPGEFHPAFILPGCGAPDGQGGAFGRLAARCARPSARPGQARRGGWDFGVCEKPLTPTLPTRKTACRNSDSPAFYPGIGQIDSPTSLFICPGFCPGLAIYLSAAHFLRFELKPRNIKVVTSKSSLVPVGSVFVFVSWFHLFSPIFTSRPQGGGGAVMRFRFRISDFGFATQGEGGVAMHPTAFPVKTVEFADCSHLAFCTLQSALAPLHHPITPPHA